MIAQRRTKIISTIGPATGSPGKIEALLRGGVNVFRLNMSHAKHDVTREHVEIIRRLTKSLNMPAAILMDIQGPAIRTSTIPENIELKVGQKLAIGVRGAIHPEVTTVGVNYDGLVGDLSVGDTLVIDNGSLFSKVIEIDGDVLVSEVMTEGTLGSRRHINLPGVRVNLPGLTEKDIEDVKFGVEMDVDFIAMSFAREAKDVRQLRELIAEYGGSQAIIAKIENQQGVANVESILEAADGIMVARGDLGMECSFEDIPIIQQSLVRSCLKVGKPVIVATHMLESMIESPSPTRAEVTDISIAVYTQADAIMLSGETSVGKYPEKCVEVMGKVTRRTEQHEGVKWEVERAIDDSRAKLMDAATQLADALGTRTPIVVFTRSGRMARAAAWFRPRKSPIYAFTNNAKLCNQLNLSWGVTPYLIDFDANPDVNEKTALTMLRDMGNVAPGDDVVFVSDATVNDMKVKALQLYRVE